GESDCSQPHAQHPVRLPNSNALSLLLDLCTQPSNDTGRLETRRHIGQPPRPNHPSRPTTQHVWGPGANRSAMSIGAAGCGVVVNTNSRTYGRHKPTYPSRPREFFGPS
ncbi:hypothetical protein BD779DRAFT_1529165, partial [Infundibulicybe gibba]